MSYLILGKDCSTPASAAPVGMNASQYYAEAVSCPVPPGPPIPPPPVGPEFFILFDWDACLIDGVHYKTPDRMIADGMTYVSPNWPAGNYCDNFAPGAPFANPGGAVDGVTVWQIQGDGSYLCVAATGYYLFAGYIGQNQALLPPGIACAQNDRPIPTEGFCDCCAGAPTDIIGVLYCSTYSIP